MAISETVFEAINGQSFDYSATAVSSTAFPDGTDAVRLTATTDCYIAFGTSPAAASTTGIFMAAYETEYFKAKPGYKVSALAGGTAGSMKVTSVARG